MPTSTGPTASGGATTSVKAAGLAVWAIALIVVAGFLFVAASAAAGAVYVRRGGGGGSNWNKFRMESANKDLNPLGEEYPSSFVGGSMIAQHNEF